MLSLLSSTRIVLIVAAASCARSTPEDVANEVVSALRKRDIETVVHLAHAEKGIRFTPYTRVDTVRDRRLTRGQLSLQWRSTDSLVWGESDGTGDPIRLSFKQYFEKFVHDFDVAAAPRVARDSAPMGIGNSLNNMRAVYPAATIIEFNTPGTDPRYGGMDWRSLWIVMEKVGSDWFVVGLIHGSWTI